MKWFWSKKKEEVVLVKPKKKYKIVVTNKKSFDVRKITVTLTMDNGELFNTIRYGFVYQNHPKYGSNDPGTVNYTVAAKAAENFISHFNPYDTFVDDCKKPLKSICGKVVKAEILPWTDQPYIQEFDISEVIEKEE